MKVDSRIGIDGSVHFDHYCVKKRGNNFFAVCDQFGEEITSGSSMGSATKKAKLLEIGYQTGYKDRGYWYDEW